MKTDKSVEKGISGLDIRITVSVAVCCIVSTFLNRCGVKFAYEGMEMEILQKMTACISCLLCCQDSVEFSVKAGINRMIITLIGGAAAIAVALIDQQISSEWLFDLLVIIGVPVVIWLCKAAKVPSMFTGVGLVPYDILANYFRGTLGIFDDLMECPDMVQKAVDLFTDLQIANLQYFRFVQMPVKRVMFWMHKGVDGFMSPKQFETLYWNPFLKVIHALVDMGVTPIIYTEGNYESRLEQMTGLPENKCVVHFENVDLQRAKNTVGKTNCITGNFPIYLLEYGTVEQVVEEAKRQIDIGAPGGGFIFETNASIEVVKRENLMALYDTVRSYGKAK